MNLLQRQGFFNSIALYLGVALGFFNSVILFQRVLSLEEIGYFTLLITISVLYTQFSSLGLSSVIIRYFPFYKTDDKNHGGFPLFVAVVSLLGFLIITLLFLLFKEVVFAYYADKSGASLMSKYGYYIIPVSFFTLVFLMQETMARTVFKSVFPTFLREVLIKVFTAFGILFILFKWLDFHGFIKFYLAANIFIVGIISYYTYSIRLFKPAPLSPEIKKEAPGMINYGLLSMISGSTIALIPSIGVVVLKLMNGEAMVGIYGTFLGIATVISLPAKALNTTSYQLVANAWKEEDLAKIDKIYYKTSIVQLLIGTLLLVGLIINRDNLLYLLHKPEYGSYFQVLILLGTAFLIDITGGLNGAIISFSKHYKVVVWFLLITVVLAAVLNFSVISQFGIVGAAWCYVIIMLFLNVGYWLYVTLKFKIQPFCKKHFYNLLIGAFCLIIGLQIPALQNHYLDILVRSVLVSLIYTALIYKLEISTDINDLINKVLRKKAA